MTQYYTYTYFDPVTNNPVYVGEGHGRRAYSHIKKSANKLFHNHIKQRQFQKLEMIIKIENTVDRMAASAMEKSLILQYGRIDKGTGTLYNQTAGGECGPKRKSGYVQTDDHKAKRNLNQWKGVKRGPLSDEHRAKCSKSLTGKKYPNRKPHPRVSCLFCQKEIAINIFMQFHGDKCKNKPQITSTPSITS